MFHPFYHQILYPMGPGNASFIQGQVLGSWDKVRFEEVSPIFCLDQDQVCKRTGGGKGDLTHQTFDEL